MKMLAMLFLAGMGVAQNLMLEPVPNPAPAGSLQPNLSAAVDGSPLLTWTEKLADGTYALKLVRRHGANWAETQTIASHRHIFRHPAEIPGMLAMSTGTFIAHWVETPQPGIDAEFVFVSTSRDGIHWSTPVMVNRDRSQVEHGLASIAESGKGEASITWLQALKGEDGPVTLMRSVIGEDGKVTKEEILDSDVCACCPTSIVHTSRGLLVAYRDHTPADVRDISTIRFENGKWTPSRNLFADNWKLNACPINAAAASAKGDRVAVSWFTGANTPHVAVDFSGDAGTTFSKPVTVSTGVTHGYTAIALDETNGAYVSWLQQASSGTLVLARHVASNGTMGPVTEVAKGDRQALGYPRLVRAESQTWITWTSSGKIQTARLK